MIKFIKYSKSKLVRHRKKILKILSLFIFSATFFILISNFLSIKISADYTIEPKQEIFVEKDFKGILYFNHIGQKEGLTKKVLDYLSETEDSVDIAMYSFNNDSVIEKISSLMDEIKINIIVPNTKNSQHERVFEGSEIEFKSVGKDADDNDTIGQLMHHKFLIFDKYTEDKKIIFGSANLTEIQEDYDPSFILITEDKYFIEPFIEEMSFLDKNVNGLKKLRKSEYKPFSRKINYQNGFMEIWFGPGYGGNSIKSRLIEIIENSEKDIKILGWQINDRDIFNSLFKKIKEGINVEIIIDDYYLWEDRSIVKDLFYLQKEFSNLKVISDSYSSLYIQDGYAGEDINIISKDFNSFLHQHTIISDSETVLTGTNNWGHNGFYTNDESIIVTNIDWLVSEYGFYFEDLKNKVLGQDLDIKINGNKIEIKNDFYNANKIIIYEEKSYPNKVGDKCFESEFKKTLVVPENCLFENMKIFVNDKNGKLIGSKYFLFAGIVG